MPDTPPSAIDDPAEAMQHWHARLVEALIAADATLDGLNIRMVAAEVRGLGRLLVAMGLVAPEDWQRSLGEQYEQEYSELVNHTGRYARGGGTVLTAERGDDDHGN